MDLFGPFQHFSPFSNFAKRLPDESSKVISLFMSPNRTWLSCFDWPKRQISYVYLSAFVEKHWSDNAPRSSFVVSSSVSDESRSIFALNADNFALDSSNFSLASFAFLDASFFTFRASSSARSSSPILLSSSLSDPPPLAFFFAFLLPITICFTRPNIPTFSFFDASTSLSSPMLLSSSSSSKSSSSSSWGE